MLPITQPEMTHRGWMVGSMTARGRLGIAGTLASLVFVAGCTTGGTHPSGGGSRSGQPVTARSNTPTPPVGFGTRQTSLDCPDAVGVPSDQVQPDLLQLFAQKADPAPP